MGKEMMVEATRAEIEVLEFKLSTERMLLSKLKDISVGTSDENDIVEKYIKSIAQTESSLQLMNMIGEIMTKMEDK